jgi:hypothetical protein
MHHDQGEDKVEEQAAPWSQGHPDILASPPFSWHVSSGTPLHIRIIADRMETE